MEYQSDKRQVNNIPRDIEPIVKIMVSPNTPEPDFEDSQRGSESASSSDTDVRQNNTQRNHNCDSSSGSSGDLQNHSYSPTTTKLTDLFSSGPGPMSNKDIPICIDFGIQDYLCRVEEAEFDLSSDTDASYLGATPPHRFSDGEIDPIESMPIVLDTHFNFQHEQLPQSEVDEISKRISLKDINFHKSLFSLHLNAGASTSNGYNKIKTIHDRRCIRRNISLPAALFKSYLLEQQQQQQQNSDCNNHLRKENEQKDDLESESMKNPPLPILTRIESISNSSQLDLEESKTSDYDNLRNSIDSVSLQSIGSNWNISVDSEGGEEQPFNSVEKQGLLMRYMRQKLIRQNTDNNFAPPEFCIAES